MKIGLLVLLLGAGLSAQGQSTRLVRTVAVSTNAATGVAAPENAEPFRLAGTVVDSEGRPVAGALVEAYDNAGSPAQGAESVLRQRATTGAEGRFSLQLPRAPAQLLARKAGLAPTWWSRYPGGAEELTNETLVLSAPTVLTGQVVDEADKPVADAEVWVTKAYLERAMGYNITMFAYLYGQPAREAFSVRTTAEGKFRIENLPPGASVDFGAGKAGKVLRVPERQYVGPDTLFHAGDQEIKLVVEAAGSIEGKVVVKESGQPLAGARFSLFRNEPGYRTAPGGEAARSGADGRFVVADIAPGKYMLRATWGTNNLPEWVAEPVAVNVAANQIVRNVQIEAVRGGFLKAVVLAKEDLSAARQASLQVSQGAYRAFGSTDSNGVALFRLPSGTYHVMANRGEAPREGLSLNVEDGETNRHEFVLGPPPRLVGTVRDPAGQPAAGLPVKLVGSFMGNSGEVKTDAKGHFEVPWSAQRISGLNTVPCLVVRDLQRNLAVAQDIESSTGTMELRLEPGLVVLGQVEEPGGKPVTNAAIQVFIQLGNTGMQFESKTVPVDAQGHFELRALPPDRHYNLQAGAKGYGSLFHMAEREDSSTNCVEVPTFVLKVADQKLAGQVLDADDKPVSGARVSIYGPEQPNTSVRSDAQGRFAFDAVCEGAVQASATARGAYGGASAQGGDTNVVIHLGAQAAYSFAGSTPAPKRASLKGKALPDLTAVNLTGDTLAAGKPVLVCLFDLEQRPSRRVLRTLAEQHEALKQKGLSVVGLQAVVTSADTLKEWKTSNPLPFPVGQVAEKSEQTKWATQVESLPWLILTDKEHRIMAEGFSLEELEAKLGAAGK